MRTIFAVLAGWLLAVTPASAEDIGKRTEHLSAQIGGGKVDYYVQVPKDYSPDKTYGMIVHIPGMGAARGTV